MHLCARLVEMGTFKMTDSPWAIVAGIVGGSRERKVAAEQGVGQRREEHLALVGEGEGPRRRGGLRRRRLHLAY